MPGHAHAKPILEQRQGRSRLLAAPDAPIGGLSLGDLLRHSTPLGAAALTLNGTPLPLTVPWRLQGTLIERVRATAHGRRDCPRRSYVDKALADYLEYDSDIRRRLEALFVSPTRADELPAYWPSRTWDSTPNIPWASARNNWRLAKCVVTAVDADLNRDVLLRYGTGDHWQASAGRDRDLSDARKKRKAGRLVLHRLGAWPWAHADDGVLPYGWNGCSRLDVVEPPFDAPLIAWQRQAREELRAEAERTNVALWRDLDGAS